MVAKTNFKKIAVFGGTGNLGTTISKALLADKTLNVTIFTRNDTIQKGEKKSLFEEFTTAGGHVKPVDTSNLQELSEALRGIEVVVSIVGGPGLEGQALLIEASKNAGTVKRFYPSEFGFDDLPLENVDHPVIKTKREIRKKVVAAGLELVVILSSFFLEWATSPFYSFDDEKLTVDITGDGNQKVSFTALEDIGSYLTASINDPRLSPDNKDISISPKKGEYYLRIASVHKSLNEILQYNERLTGKKFVPNYVSIESEQKFLKDKNPYEVFGNYLRLIQAEGKAYTLSNFPVDSIKPKDFETLYSKH